MRILGLSGSLRVGFISYMAYEYLPLIVRAFRAQHPNVDIELFELRVTQQLEMLLATSCNGLPLTKTQGLRRPSEPYRHAE